MLQWGSYVGGAIIDVDIGRSIVCDGNNADSACVVNKHGAKVHRRRRNRCLRIREDRSKQAERRCQEYQNRNLELPRTIQSTVRHFATLRACLRSAATAEIRHAARVRNLVCHL